MRQRLVKLVFETSPYLWNVVDCVRVGVLGHVYSSCVVCVRVCVRMRACACVAPQALESWRDSLAMV